MPRSKRAFARPSESESGRWAWTEEDAKLAGLRVGVDVTLRSVLSWNSPERRLERTICRKFAREGSAEEAFPLPLLDADIRFRLCDKEFIRRVCRLVGESMYSVRLKVRDSRLIVTAAD